MPKSKRSKSKSSSQGRGAGNTTSQIGGTGFTSAGASGRIPRSMALATSISAVPQHFRTTLNWSYLLNGSVTGTYAETVIILNSPYDPDNALGGTQPVGFAKLIAMYSKCFTLAARARCHGVFTASSAVPPNDAAAEVGMFITTSTSAVSSMTAGVEQGLAVTKVIGSNPDSFDLSLGMDVGTFLDKPDVLDDPQLFCTSSANPTQLIALHFANQNFGVSVTSAILARIIVQFDVVFTDPIPFT